MIINKEMEKCYGCTACAHVCPVNAIEMKINERGFKYPIINEVLCINCGRCEKTCPLNNDLNSLKAEVHNQKVYAVKVVEEWKRLESRSGGAFSVVAEYVLQNGGIVYGVGLTETLECCYQRVTSLEGLKILKGSKYVQADVGDIFRQVYEDLADDYRVLFVGTACVVAGLRLFLGDFKKGDLITGDLICHGVVSPAIYRVYLDYLSSVNKEKIVSFNFRDKSFGWHSHKESYVLESGEKRSDDRYKNLYYSHLCMRESCYNCQFTDVRRVSDITFADFWGAETHYAEWDDDKGISLFLANTEKGQEIFCKIVSEIEFLESSIEKCRQPHLYHPVKRPEEIDEFWNDYLNKDFRYILKKYAHPAEGFKGDTILHSRWMNKLKRGIRTGDYLEKHGIYNILVCGFSYNTELFLMDIDKSVINVMGILKTSYDRVCEEEIDETISKIDIQNLSMEMINEVDAFIITNEMFCVDILEELYDKGVPMHKIVPMSFIVAEEV